MRALISIDDTDSIEFGATGELATCLSRYVEEQGWGRSYPVTRHQLLIHADIPYTSHNSSMCFAADIDASCLDKLVDYATAFLAHESAAGSDPGLCIAAVEPLDQPELLVDFGFKAKKIVLKKQDAYDLAGQMGIHLSEHGGTGQGVIGALAGAGLRLSGNDGRMQGQLKVTAESGTISVGDLCTQGQVDLVKSLDGTLLGDNEMIRLGEFLKTVLQDGKFVFLVYPVAENTESGARWQACSKQQLKSF